MSKVEHMVCPGCSRMLGTEHLEDCPWNDLPPGFRPEPGASEAYREAKIREILGPSDRIR